MEKDQRQVNGFRWYVEKDGFDEGYNKKARRIDGKQQRLCQPTIDTDRSIQDLYPQRSASNSILFTRACPNSCRHQYKAPDPGDQKNNPHLGTVEIGREK